MSDEEMYIEQGKARHRLKQAREQADGLRTGLLNAARDLEAAAKLLRDFAAEPAANPHSMPWAAKKALGELPDAVRVSQWLDELKRQTDLIGELERQIENF